MYDVCPWRYRKEEKKNETTVLAAPYTTILHTPVYWTTDTTPYMYTWCNDVFIVEDRQNQQTPIYTGSQQIRWAKEKCVRCIIWLPCCRLFMFFFSASSSSFSTLVVHGDERWKQHTYSYDDDVVCMSVMLSMLRYGHNRRQSKSIFEKRQIHFIFHKRSSTVPHIGLKCATIFRCVWFCFFFHFIRLARRILIAIHIVECPENTNTHTHASLHYMIVVYPKQNRREKNKQNILDIKLKRIHVQRIFEQTGSREEIERM